MNRFLSDKYLIAIFLIGFLLRLYYFSYTDYQTRTHDVEGHLEYITYIANNYRLPSTNQCWQCFQPPLYYILATILNKILDAFFELSPEKTYRVLQLFSLSAYSLFNIVGIALFKKLLKKKKLILMATLLFTFWPSGIIHSVRIGNDVLLYLFYSLSLYYLVKWWINEKQLDLHLASFFAIFSLLTKSNGIVIFVIIIITLLLRVFANKYPLRYFLGHLETIFILLLGATITLYPILSDTNRDNWLVGNYKGLDPILNVDNKLVNYLIFDIESFFKEANIIPWSDIGGRQLFWNYLLKTSLFGGFPIQSSFHTKMAIFLSVILLLQIIFTIAGSLLIERRKIIRFTPIILNFLFLLASLIFLRAKIPVAPSSDFRYIFPLLLSWVVMVTVSIDNVKKNTALRHISYSLLIIFVTVSIIFFLVPMEVIKS